METLFIALAVIAAGIALVLRRRRAGRRGGTCAGCSGGCTPDCTKRNTETAEEKL